MTLDAFVYVSRDGVDRVAGRLYSHRRRGHESASFSYADTYLADPAGYALDPQLPLVTGTLQTDIGLALFRAFADSSPDRWGRDLILRHERMRCQALGTTARSLGEFDFLLGVRDDLRQGALRFCPPAGLPFLATADTGVPVLTDLPGLLGAADRVATDQAGDDDLALLVRAGSSLGGARPKAHVLDQHGRLAIAKFPSPATDQWNVMVWEKVARDLAAAAGVRVADAQLVDVGGRGVLVVDRFDRAGDVRIGYSSALTLLEAADGEQRSYTDIAALIETCSRAATRDLEELWRRLVFTVLISNTDDHLRNHGFLHDGGDSWLLSPAFDLNPDPAPGPKHLSTAIDAGETSASIDTALDVAPLFRLRPDRARGVLSEVVAAVAEWRVVAGRHGLSGSQRDAMRPAFVHRQLERAIEVIGGDGKWHESGG